jgi:hypothetical protein
VVNLGTRGIAVLLPLIDHQGTGIDTATLALGIGGGPLAVGAIAEVARRTPRTQRRGLATDPAPRSTPAHRP